MASFRRRFLAFWRVVCWTLILCCSSALAATYTYDAGGRLVAVTTSSGSTSQYVYDALGNLLSVNSIATGQLAIFAFSPGYGPIGQQVSISGSGFTSAVVIKFNGVASAVTSYTSTTIVTSVPVGATTGFISVAVGATTTVSSDMFHVDTGDDGVAPVVTSFLPAIANGGMSISVAGNHFISTLGATQAGVNEVVSTVTPSANTSLTFAVPSTTGSGPVAVVTPYGAGLSSQSLIVVPTSVGAANVVSSAVLSVDGAAQNLNVNVANKYAAAVFEGQEAQWLSLQFSQLVTTPATQSLAISVYDPNGILVKSATVSATALSVHLPPLPHPGTYTVVAKPSGSATLAQFSEAVESNVAIGPSHSTTVNVTIAGQTKRVTIAAPVGANLGIGMTSLTTVPASGSIVSATMQRADGLVIAEAICGAPGYYQCSDYPRNILGGTMGIIVAPFEGPVQTFSATVWATPDTTGSLAIGTPTTIATSFPAQSATYTFQGTAGELVSFAVDQIVLGSGAALIDVSVLDPSNHCLVQFGSGTDCPIAAQTTTEYENLTALPVTGTYTVVVQPGGLYETQATTGSLRLTFSQTMTTAIPLDVAGGTAVSTTLEGQRQQLTFSVTTPGDNLGLGMTNVAVAPAGSGFVAATVYNASGTVVGSAACSAPGYYNCAEPLRNLPVGNYTILITPADTRTQTFSLKLWLSHDVTGTVAVGTPTTIATNNPGQNATYTFAGTAGQQLQMALNQIILGAGTGSIYISVFDPSNNCVIASGSSTLCPIGVTNTSYQSLTTLMTTGTYKIFVQPRDAGSSAGTGSVQVSLSPTSTSPLTLDAPSGTPVSTSVIGQQVKYTFSITTAGDNLGLGLTNTTTTPTGGAVQVTVKNSSGTTVGSGTWELALRNLAIDSYTVTLAPYSAQTSTFNTTLWVSHDVSGAIVLGAPTTIATTMPGQNATYTFAGTATQPLSMALTNVTLGTGAGYLLTSVADFASKSLYSNNITNTIYTTFTPTATGAGVFYMHPVNSASTAVTGSMTVTLASTTTTPLTLDTPSGTPVSTTVQGQQLNYTFSVTTAGDNLGLGLTNTTTSPAAGAIQVTVKNSSGTTVGSGTWEVALRNLAVGTYTINLAPYSIQTSTFSTTLWLSHDVTGTIAIGTPITIATTKPGQNATYTFTGSASESLHMAISAVSLSTGGYYLATSITDPTSKSIYSGNITTTTNATLTLTTAGAYIFYVHPVNSGATAVTGSMTVALTAN